METVGIRELKAHTSAILRRVRQQRETIKITYRGEVVATLTPVEPDDARPAQLSEIWAEVDALAAEIGARWPTGIGLRAALEDVRREG